MAKYHAGLREIAKKCEFTNEDEVIRDHLIKTMKYNCIQVKGICNNCDINPDFRQSSRRRRIHS